jgi:phenylpropionate dioxygenase-like ring-hydroxylating dioxygenase large terminal subunit
VTTLARRHLGLANDASDAQVPEGDRRPPTYAGARTRHQKARAAGLDPNYWYPVEYDDRVKVGEVREVVFWGRSYALFRGTDGKLAVVENRCAHRQLRLSVGSVEGCNLVCAYHGWSYDGDGRVVGVGHELFGHGMPKVKIGHRAVATRYGLIWVFFGDPSDAGSRSIPNIPELEGKDAWSCVPLDFVWKAHHSMIIDNVSDFTHAHLHQKYRPFSDAKLTECRTEADKVFVAYEAKIGTGPIYRRIVDHVGTNTNRMTLCYEYPFQWSNTDDRIKHHCFVLPMDRKTTRAFFLFYYDPRIFKLPFLPVSMPKRLVRPLLHLGNGLLVRPLLGQDGFAVEEEQRSYENHFDAPMMDLNPAIGAFQNLTIRKWEEHLDSGGRRKEESAPPSGVS